MLEQAILAGGNFWELQEIFENIPGVLYTQIGYTGGITSHPSYLEVSTGKTGHAEALEITYDNNLITYEELLDVFFGSHNPTTINQQGPDIGTQYRSAIFYLTPKQKSLATNKIIELKKLQKYKAPIVTEVTAAKKFYPAENHHQHFMSTTGETSCKLHY